MARQCKGDQEHGGRPLTFTPRSKAWARQKARNAKAARNMAAGLAPQTQTQVQGPAHQKARNVKATRNMAAGLTAQP